MRVLGSAGSDAGSRVVKEAGADEVFNHKENDYLDKVFVSIGQCNCLDLSDNYITALRK